MSNSQPIRKAMSEKPSSTRTRHMQATSRANRAQRWGDGNDEVHDSQLDRAPNPSNKKTELKVWLGGFAAAGAMVWLAATYGEGAPQPVNVDTLPRDEVALIQVPTDASHKPSGIASMVMGNEANLGQVTAEIQDQIDGETVPTGTILELPKNQLDLDAVERYEAGAGK